MFNASLSRTMLVAATVILADRVVKIWVVQWLDLENRREIEVLDPVFNLTMAWNQGINFGLLDVGASGRYWLIVLALGIVLALLVWVRAQRGWASALGAGAIVGGALGNVWDRLQWGAVADFINMSCCGIDNPFAFNLADAAIFVGVTLLIVFADSKPVGRKRT